MNKRTLLILFFASATLILNAQETLSADNLFKQAREAAFEDKNYSKAKLLAYQALSISPGYADIEIFLGRVYTWNKQYDSAKFHLLNVLSTLPVNEDGSVAFADLEYWNDHYNEALEICDHALITYPGSVPLLLRKAKILNASKRYSEASIISKQLVKLDGNNTAVIALSSSLKDASTKNKISLTYDHTSFDKQFTDPWQIISMSYGRQTNFGSVIARVNYANRFARNGIQGELDAYPRISKRLYSYVSFGYSNNVGIFPKYRAGFSLYANLPQSMEAEAGLRYLYFSGSTIVYTLHLAKYYKRFLFGVRTYLTPSQAAISQSYSIAARYYFGGADDYCSLNIGTGISPDDNNQNIVFNSKNMLSSRQASATFNHTFLKRNVFSIGAGLINREYRPLVTGNQLNISAGLSRRF